MMTRDHASTLRIALTTKPYARLLDAFYREYKTAFVLSSERETRAGLRLCLSLNGVRGEGLHARFGPSREHIAVLRDAGGTIAAGMNFICFPMAEAAGVMTVHTVYVFVAPTWRGRGLLRSIYQTIEAIARDYALQWDLRSDVPIIFVGEQKDPFKMTVGAFRGSVDSNGQDAFDRLAIWNRLGARVLLFRYVLPPLTVRGTPDSTLFLRVMFREEISDGAPDPAPRVVDPNVLKEHLRRFFAISVAKGQYDPDRLPEVRDQMEDLDGRRGLGHGVPALKMPSEARLAHWKRVAHEVPCACVCPGYTTIGTLLGVASMPDASVAAAAVAPASRA